LHRDRFPFVLSPSKHEDDSSFDKLRMNGNAILPHSNSAFYNSAYEN